MKSLTHTFKYIESSSVFFLFFFIRILFTSLISIFLLERGYSALNVSLISAISLIATFFLVPVFGKYYDLYGGKRTSTILLLAASIFSIIFAYAENFPILALSYSIVVVCINALHPYIEKSATQTEFSYGFIRIWGTLGNAAGTKIGGMMYQYVNPHSIFILFCILSITTLLIINVNTENRNIMKSDKLENAQKKALNFSTLFVLYLIICFLFYAALDTKNLYIVAYLKSIKFSVNSVSTILFIASLFEIPIVLFGGHLVDKLQLKTLLACCLTLLLIQFLTYAAHSSYNLIIIVTLLVNSVASMLYIMINMKIIKEIMNEQYQLTALSLTTSVRSLSAITGQMIGGKIIDNYSYSLLFIILTIFILLAIITLVFIKFPKSNNFHNLYS